MQDATELLPQPPFDLEKEQLVDVSVELCGDRLKGIVAWLVDCLRNHQVILQALQSAHDAEIPLESQVASLEGAEAAEDDDAGSGSPSSRARTPKKSVAKSLQSSMKDELLSMQVTKIQHEMNTLPTFEDLERQRESMLAEFTSLSDNVNNSMKEREDKIQGALGTVTDELHQRLQRICDDLVQRLGDLEQRAAQTEEAVAELKPGFVSSRSRPDSRNPKPRTPDSLQAAAAAEAVVNVPSQRDADSDDGGTIVETSRATQPATGMQYDDDGNFTGHEGPQSRPRSSPQSPALSPPRSRHGGLFVK
jgi:hypothetical protein